MQCSKLRTLAHAIGILGMMIGNAAARDPVRRVDKNADDSREALRGGVAPPPHMSGVSFGGAGTRLISLTSAETAAQQGGQYQMNLAIGQPFATARQTSGPYSFSLGFLGPAVPPAPEFGDDVCVGGANAGNSCSQASDCPGGACRLKNRFTTITIPVTATTHGIKVKLADLDANSVATPGSYEGTDRWAGVPLLGINDGISPSFNASRLQCAFHSQDWSAVGPVHLYGDVVVPLSTYDAAICSSASGPCSTDLRVTTAKFGDVVTPVNTVNFQDVNSIVAKFQGTPAGPTKTRTKLNGSIVNPSNPINFQEVSACVSAFQSKAFKAVVTTPPATCP